MNFSSPLGNLLYNTSGLDSIQVDLVILFDLCLSFSLELASWIVNRSRIGFLASFVNDRQGIKFRTRLNCNKR